MLYFIRKKLKTYFLISNSVINCFTKKLTVIHLFENIQHEIE